LIKQEKERSD